MRGREFCHIDLFDSYRAMHISRTELILIMQLHFPWLALEQELKQYDEALEALEYLEFHRLRHIIKNIHLTEAEYLESVITTDEN